MAIRGRTVTVFGFGNATETAQAVPITRLGTTQGAIPLQLETGLYYLPEVYPPLERILPHIVESRATREPVYLEIDEDSHEVTRVLFPSRTMIESVAERAENGALTVNLAQSQSVHWLSQRHERYRELVERLKAAVARREELFLTFDPISMEILDAQPASGEPPANDGSMILSPSRAAKTLADVISEARALKEFRFLAGQKSIPFDYPPNCCWSRAHQMARLMAGNGIASEKYWNFGSGWSQGKYTIKTPTPKWKKPYVEWKYHVAPVIKVRNSAGNTVRRIMDPSLFTKPVQVSTWLKVQVDAGKMRRFTTRASCYFYNPDNKKCDEDPDYKETEKKLKEHIKQRDSIV